MIKRTIVSFVFVVFLSQLYGYSYKPKEVGAVTILGISGVAEIVIDPAHIIETVNEGIKDARRYAIEKALKIALATAKKRLLDMIVDQIISWIQGNGSPKFVTDFEGFIEDATQVVTGDVVQEIGLGAVCKPFKTKLQIDLQQPPKFSRQVSCTLDKIVDNIEDFYENFTDGGWLAYHEIYQPQNNYYGAYALALDETTRKIEQKQEANRQEVTSGQGFLSVKRCVEWTLYHRAGEDITTVDIKPVSANFDFKDPSSPPGTRGDDPSPLDPGEEWKCTKSENTTPGTAIAEGLNRALYSDLDFIANAEDLTVYFGAIFDAAINRLVKEGVNGVKNLGASGNTPETDCDDPRLSASARSACQEYSDTQKENDDFIKQTNLVGRINQAAIDILNASTSLRNTAIKLLDLASTTQNLISCETSRGLSCVQNPTLLAITSSSLELREFERELGEIQIRLNTINAQVSGGSATLKQIAETNLDEVLLPQLNTLVLKINSITETTETRLEELSNRLLLCKNPGGAYTCQ